ncbi:MAG: Gfo/Idh/MocA family oxidoreductase [Chloroflexi bacterium]|nr:Gfo/Idh/MocA family oxidoreductase [Chloroflexota bacterium]
MAGKLGVGIIGCGGISASHVEALGGLADDCAVVAVSDPVESAARRRMAQAGVSTWYPDYADLLADEHVDVVTIGVPHYLHAGIAVAAARAGKHVFVEKPMALTAGEVHEMLVAARAAGVKMTVSSELANPIHRFVKERVLPALGSIRFSYLVDFYLRTTAYYRTGPWRGTWAFEGGGVFANQAIYTWHQYTWLLGEVDLAYGYWANILHPSIEVEDLGYGLVKFRDGSCGKLFCTTCCDAPTGTRRLEIVGAEGEISSDVPWLRTLDFHLKSERLDAALHRDLGAHLRVLDEPPYAPWSPDDQKCRIRAQLADLFRAIRDDREPGVSAASGGEAIKILNGLHWHGWRHSARLRDWIYGRYDLPPATHPEGRPTVEDAVAADWRGGQLIPDVLAIVRSPTRSLDAPFL